MRGYCAMGATVLINKNVGVDPPELLAINNQVRHFVTACVIASMPSHRNI